MRLSGQFQFFKKRDFKLKKRKVNNFPPLGSFCVGKIVAFVV